MTDWIDKVKTTHEVEQKRQDRQHEVFGPTAKRIWEALLIQIRRDVTKLNNTCRAIMKGEIKINSRDLIPDDHEVNLDKLEFPATRMTVTLDIGAKSIRIGYERRESPEGAYSEAVNRLQLYIADDGPFSIKDSKGKTLTIEETSEYVLRVFLRT